jgi:hypothetical protein
VFFMAPILHQKYVSKKPNSIRALIPGAEIRTVSGVLPRPRYWRFVPNSHEA